MLDGLLQVSIFTAPGVPSFSPQPGDIFEILSAGGELTGDFAAFDLPFIAPITGVGLFAFPDFIVDAYFVAAFSTAAAIGADFNGDGIVDDTDLLIWRSNLGNPGGPGDANGDGIVNGADFLIWQMQVGGPGMGAGSGAIAGSGGIGGGAVPEPASMALLAIGGLLALAFRRRQSS
jgi:hypothetical protein